MTNPKGEALPERIYLGIANGDAVKDFWYTDAQAKSVFNANGDITCEYIRADLVEALVRAEPVAWRYKFKGSDQYYLAATEPELTVLGGFEVRFCEPLYAAPHTDAAPLAVPEELMRHLVGIPIWIGGDWASRLRELIAAAQPAGNVTVTDEGKININITNA